MVDTGIFCTTLQVQHKSGQNASSASNVEAFINDFVSQAESLINTTIRFNFSDNFSTLNNDVRQILSMIASDLAAIDVITYDMSGFVTRAEAENMINVRRDSALRGLSILRDKKQETFINGA